ncbi:hypothetical protein E2C01_092148 [Portunus trituberculatus]|uniref:Uncharacterized protein n=1 Tax=Portunus trituberculatus TaxID=210409 RepID=A0A5B7JPU6_PORTR|nr:hypothetical protein [Portunus trituberculatus]
MASLSKVVLSSVEVTGWLAGWLTRWLAGWFTAWRSSHQDVSLSPAGMTVTFTIPPRSIFSQSRIAQFGINDIPSPWRHSSA